MNEAVVQAVATAGPGSDREPAGRVATPPAPIHDARASGPPARAAGPRYVHAE